MIKGFLKRYKIDILEGYIVAMMCFTCMSSFGMNWMTTAVMIGVANTYLVNPVVKALKFGNVTNDDIMQINHKTFIINLLKSLLICSLLVTGYYLVNTYLFATAVEPITFGIFFKLLDNGLVKLGRRFKKGARSL